MPAPQFLAEQLAWHPELDPPHAEAMNTFWAPRQLAALQAVQAADPAVAAK